MIFENIYSFEQRDVQKYENKEKVCMTSILLVLGAMPQVLTLHAGDRSGVTHFNLRGGGILQNTFLFLFKKCIPGPVGGRHTSKPCNHEAQRLILRDTHMSLLVCDLQQSARTARAPLRCGSTIKCHLIPGYHRAAAKGARGEPWTIPTLTKHRCNKHIITQPAT